MLAGSLVFPELAHFLVLHHKHTFLIAFGQGELCVLVSVVGCVGKVAQRLVVVDGHAASVHIAIGQIILCLGKSLAGRTLEPHGSRGVVLVDTFSVIEGIAQVELAFLTAGLGRFLVAFHGFAELLLVVEVVALLEPLVGCLCSNT